VEKRLKTKSRRVKILRYKNATLGPDKGWKWVGESSTKTTLLSIISALFVSLIGALTFGSDREINEDVTATKFVCVCVTYN
jgi:hypothetical protein